MHKSIRYVYLSVPAAMLAGIVVGAILAAKKDHTALFLAAQSSLASPTLCIDSLLKALRQMGGAVFLLWVLGTTPLGSVPIVLVAGMRGGSLGFAIGALVGTYGLRGFFAALCGVFPHNLLYIPFLCLLSVYTLRFSLDKVRQKETPLFNYSLSILLLALPILLGCLVEGYLSAPLFRSILGATI